MGSDSPKKNPGIKTLGDLRGKHAVEKKWKLTALWAGEKKKNQKKNIACSLPVSMW